MSALPWARWMQLAFGVMRVAPATFWQMSVREWAAALEGHLAACGHAPALSRRDLEALMARFPDTKDQPHDA